MYCQKRQTPEEKHRKVLLELAFCNGWKFTTNQELPHWKTVKNEITGLTDEDRAFQAGRLLAEQFAVELA